MFSLTDKISETDLSSLKAFLMEACPDVKSSHRCEALARGFGFQTYAALKAVTKAQNFVEVEANGQAFQSYLGEHDFNCGSTPFFQSFARLALLHVHDNYPYLTRYRIGVGYPTVTNADGSKESWNDCQGRFVADRKALLTNSAVAPFLTALALLSRIPKTKTVRSNSSYKLKHIAENLVTTYPGGEPLGPIYVPNGIFIAAAIHAGFDHKPWDDRGFSGPNACFNMADRVIRNLDAEVRTDGAEAQHRKWVAQERVKRAQYPRGTVIW